MWRVTSERLSSACFRAGPDCPYRVPQPRGPAAQRDLATVPAYGNDPADHSVCTDRRVATGFGIPSKVKNTVAVPHGQAYDPVSQHSFFPAV
jgi:hypothetical protein